MSEPPLTRSSARKRQAKLLPGLVRTPRKVRRSDMNNEETAEPPPPPPPVNVRVRSEFVTIPATDASSLAALGVRAGKSDWVERFAAIDDLRALFIHAPAVVASWTAFPSALSFLRMEANSLRSITSRNALLAFADAFHYCHAASVLEDVDSTVEILLQRATHDLRFIASAANSALEELTAAHVAPAVLSALLRHSCSKNRRLCQIAAHAAARVVAKLGHSVLSEDAALAESVMLHGGQMFVTARRPALEMLRNLPHLHRADFERRAIASGLRPTVASELAAQLFAKPKSATGRGSLREMMAARRKAAAKRQSGDDVVLVASQNLRRS